MIYAVYPLKFAFLTITGSWKRWRKKSQTLLLQSYFFCFWKLFRRLSLQPSSSKCIFPRRPTDSHCSDVYIPTISVQLTIVLREMEMLRWINRPKFWSVLNSRRLDLVAASFSFWFSLIGEMKIDSTQICSKRIVSINNFSGRHYYGNQLNPR